MHTNFLYQVAWWGRDSRPFHTSANHTTLCIICYYKHIHITKIFLYQAAGEGWPVSHWLRYCCMTPAHPFSFRPKRRNKLKKEIEIVYITYYIYYLVIFNLLLVTHYIYYILIYYIIYYINVFITFIIIFIIFIISIYKQEFYLLLA